jgi:hypothetical protein
MRQSFLTKTHMRQSFWLCVHNNLRKMIDLCEAHLVCCVGIKSHNLKVKWQSKSLDETFLSSNVC